MGKEAVGGAVALLGDQVAVAQQQEAAGEHPSSLSVNTKAVTEFSTVSTIAKSTCGRIRVIRRTDVMSRAVEGLSSGDRPC